MGKLFHTVELEGFGEEEKKDYASDRYRVGIMCLRNHHLLLFFKVKNLINFFLILKVEKNGIG